MRDFLSGRPLGNGTDWDICSPMSEEELVAAAQFANVRVRAVYKNTGTVKLEDANHNGYEFTRFRSDKYVRGIHTPSEITFTDDMLSDARRRDFCANAVYYAVKEDKFYDPLGGIGDIHAKKLRTVREAKRVFGEDGLRLMRLARIAAQTGFSPDGECTAGARENAALIRDIAPERIFAEFAAILCADRVNKDENAPYRGLCILRDTNVLRYTMPELMLGNGMKQRSDFHDFDVLEHSFRCVRFAPVEIRFAALLHDVGKPFCFVRDGNFYAHAEEGARIAREILTRFKAPKQLIAETAFLVKAHMLDFDCKTRPNKVRGLVRAANGRFENLLALKQADFSACKGDVSPAPTVVKWQKIYEQMRAEGVPFTVRDLALNGNDLKALGIGEADIGTALSDLLNFSLYDGARNNKETLIRYLKRNFLERRSL